MGTLNPSYLPSTAIIWVPQSLYANCKGWISQYGLDVRYEGWQPRKVNLAVNTAGQLVQLLLSEVEQWTDVDELTITGSLNAADMECFNKLKSLRRLDLSQTDITKIEGCNGLTLLSEIVLPTSITSIGEGAFSGCVRLTSISLPNVTIISDNAFENCTLLEQAEIQSATSVGFRAFYNCFSLTKAYFPYAKHIGMRAFENCSALTIVELPLAETIEDRALSNCLFTTISLPAAKSIGFRTFEKDALLESVSLTSATEIGSYAFSKCSSLKSVELPNVVNIGSYAFEQCYTITKIELPSSLKSLGHKCFTDCQELKDIICHVALPFNTSAFSGISNIGSITLSVPAFGVTAYKLNNDWYGFNSVQSLNENVEIVNILSDITIDNSTGVSNSSLWTLGYSTNNGKAGHLTTSTSLSVGNFTQYEDLASGNGLTTMITNAEMSSDNVSVKMKIKTGLWYFISFPFDVNLKDINVSDGVYWVVREYSGANRAARSEDTWLDKTSDSMLNAGLGYILQCSVGEKESEVDFLFPAIGNNNKNSIFSHTDVTLPLVAYNSEYLFNQNWNLIGNPYPAFYNSKTLGHKGVITTWNGNGYTAYSLSDDEYFLKPFEAFFVQKSDADGISFKANGRYLINNNESESNRHAAPISNKKRNIFNFIINNENYSDKTRLVINENAKHDYELECDASKMLSDKNDIQLYITDGLIKYAIDERPLGDGFIKLGLNVRKDDTYTIRLQDKGTENTPIVLIDNETGKRTNLSQDEYSFIAQAGEYGERFSISIGGDSNVTGINQVKSLTDTNIVWYTLDGKEITKPQNSGVYIVRNGSKVQKVIIK